MRYERPPNALRCRNEAMRFLNSMEKGESRMPFIEKPLYENFVEMEQNVCERKCHYRLFMKNFTGRYCRNCEMQKFKETLRKYCDAMEDDWK